MPDSQVTFEDVVAARETLADVALRTPVIHSHVLSGVVGGPVHLKCENLQRSGSFKVRGAYVRIAHLSEEERRRGVVAASAGNHAQGVALGSGLVGAAATVYMPQGAPLPKVAATRSYGAEVVFAGHTVDVALAAAREHAERTGAVFIHPFDHPDVIAGQGTIGLEIVEQLPEVGTIVMSLGGGGLAAGVALAAKSLRPGVRIVGVQAERAAAYPASLAAGQPVGVEPASTMADGIAVGRPGELPFELIHYLVDHVVTVSESEISRALVLCLERAKQVVEPAGVAGVAAILARPQIFEPPVVAVLSGGNIDPLLLAKVLRHGLAAAGRYLTLRVRLPDRPGVLAAMLARMGELGANVVDIVHERLGMHPGDVEVQLQSETRGPAHAEEVLDALRADGYKIVIS
ncbi:threonine dehydratase [Streptosporangium becharense]|uniref:threonine ammonia-lyase n=1 Tax=Streptosporangium becharense TaxID=1816182 RepID=A0A7W9IHY9_9ACTN|nr:threonine ammonia-lyase [Streptosporangium becharense]MBB2913399.1 threonine dehydratase [Streptosporangium becharense]MBB5821089.1 threonine dehydratase [Streptosporangium becharense]